MRVLLAAAAVLLLAPAAGATLPPANADLTAGKKIFKSTCGGCHRLKAAATTGHIGPNLTAEYVKYDVVTYMVDWGDSLMPGFGTRLSKTQIRDVAAFVVKASSTA